MLTQVEFNDEKGRPHKHIREEHYDEQNRRNVKTIDKSDCPTCPKED